MDEYFSRLVWNIDAVLFALTIFFSIAVIFYLVIKIRTKGNRISRLLSIISNLHSLTDTDKGLMIKGCVDLMKRTTAFDFFDIVKHHEKILPEQFSRQFGACMADSGKVNEVEKIAQKSNNKWLRIEAIIALGYLKSAHSLEILQKSIYAKDDDVAYFSILSLGHIKNPESAKILLRAIKDRIVSGYKIASILEGFPPVIVDDLIKSLDDPDVDLRLWALRILSRFKPRQHIAKILHLAADGSAEIRASACECLGEIAEEGAKEAVRKCLNDSEWFVRLKAIRALEKIAEGNLISEIADLIKDDNWFIQETVKELMVSHVEESIPFIENIFSSGPEIAKRLCLEVLGRSGYDKRILQDIFSPNKEIRDKAMRLLEGMLKAGGHLGLETVLITYPKEARNKIIEIIASIDKQKAEHIDKIIKGAIVEF